MGEKSVTEDPSGQVDRSVVVIKEVEGGYLITLPHILDRDLRLFTTLDAILAYMFQRLTPERTVMFCKFIGTRLIHYCNVGTKEQYDEMKKELNGHAQNHPDSAFLDGEQLY